MKRLIVVAIAMVAAVAAVLAVVPRPVTAQSAGPASKPEKVEIATFAGGCFWCVEADFDKVEGVLSTVSGYMGGTTPNPTYNAVTAGGTGHLEVVQITFDPAKISYEKMVDHFLRTIDPYDAGGQFCDRGESYTTAIFTHSPEQKRIAETARQTLIAEARSKQPVATQVRDAGPFTAAEAYHQDYHLKNPVRYAFYRHGCGRDQRLQTLWGKKAS